MIAEQNAYPPFDKAKARLWMKAGLVFFKTG
jgi:hypothetical protein